MKRPQPDIGNVLRDRFIGNLKTIRKLKRLWGTTTINGVEVLNERQYYHKEVDRSENFEKLFKFLGIYEDITASDHEGIAKGWVYFNKNNSSNISVDFDQFVSDNLNKLWWDPNDGPLPENLTLTTSIVIDIGSDIGGNNASLDHILNPQMTKEEAITSLINNYEELWDNCAITHEGVGVINKGSITDPVNKIEIPDEDDLTPDDPWLAAIARYALKDNGITCTVKNLSIGTIRRKLGAFAYGVSTTYVIDIEIPYNPFTPGEAFVQGIASDLSYSYDKKSKNSNGYKTQHAIKSMNSDDLEDDPTIVSRSYDLWEDEAEESEAKFAALWYKDGNKYYLKADSFTDPRAYNLTYDELTTYILGLLDTGYKKKKIPWYKKAIAVIIFIIAVVLAPFTGGSSLSLVSVAAAILVASLILTLFMLAFTALGMTEWASAFMEVSKWIEPLVIIASIIVMIDGIVNAINKAAAEAAKTGVEQSITDTITGIIEDQVQSFIDNIVKGATDVYAGNLASSAAIAFITKLTKVVNFGVGLKVKSIASKNKDLKAEYEKLMEESYRESDALQGFMRIYASPATSDWSIYAAEFDLPYERTGGTLSLGNVQNTTKQALRKADYKDPAFAGIFII